MAYTHYWTYTSNHTKEDFADFVADANLIIKRMNKFVPNRGVSDTSFSGFRIRLGGSQDWANPEKEMPFKASDLSIFMEGKYKTWNKNHSEYLYDMGHETFYLSYEDNDEFTFCKTARKPYDLAVQTILIRGQHLGILRFKSDGDLNEWGAAYATYLRIFGHEEHPLYNTYSPNLIPSKTTTEGCYQSVLCEILYEFQKGGIPKAVFEYYRKGLLKVAEKIVNYPSTYTHKGSVSNLVLNFVNEAKVLQLS